jgi:hypothetical protein
LLATNPFVNLVLESSSIPKHSLVRNCVVAVILFFAAHFALLVGVTTGQILFRRGALRAGGAADASARPAGSGA